MIFNMIEHAPELLKYDKKPCSCFVRSANWKFHEDNCDYYLFCTKYMEYHNEYIKLSKEY